jgi:hypothetical protein
MLLQILSVENRCQKFNNKRENINKIAGSIRNELNADIS